MVQLLGKAVSWINLALILLIASDVVLRYMFSTTPTWIVELEWHLFALLFLIAGGWSLKHDRHVRVDVLYDGYTQRNKQRLQLFGHIFFLIPWCVVLIYTSYFVAMRSYMVNETSPNAGGLPYRWAIKFCITLGFLLLLIQAIVQASDYIRQLNKGGPWR